MSSLAFNVVWFIAIPVFLLQFLVYKSCALQSTFSCPTKQVRILHEMMKTTEVEKSPTDKWIYTGEGLIQAPGSLLHFIKEKSYKYSKSCMKRKTEESPFPWLWDCSTGFVPDCVGIRNIAGRMYVDSFAVSYGWICRFKHQHDTGYKKLGGRGAGDVTDTRDYHVAGRTWAGGPMKRRRHTIASHMKHWHAYNERPLLSW